MQACVRRQQSLTFLISYANILLPQRWGKKKAFNYRHYMTSIHRADTGSNRLVTSHSQEMCFTGRWQSANIEGTVHQHHRPCDRLYSTFFMMCDLLLIRNTKNNGIHSLHNKKKQKSRTVVVYFEWTNAYDSWLVIKGVVSWFTRF